MWSYISLIILVSLHSYGNQAEFSCGSTFGKTVRLVQSTHSKPTSLNLDGILLATESAVDLTRQLRAQTPSNKRHKLKISGPNSTGNILELSSNVKDYSQTRFVQRRNPRALLENQEVIGPIEFGYPSNDGFKKMGVVRYLLREKSGMILEIGAESDLALTEFKYHLFGRNLTPRNYKTIQDINTRLLADLRQNPTLLSKVKEFAKKRKWPEGIAEKSGIAYVDNDVISILDWARKNGYTYSEMKDAGWLSLRFNHTGKPYYVVNQKRSIKIPYFVDPEHREVSIWRTRQTEQTDPSAPKYLSWPLDRSVDRDFTEIEQLYNSPELKNASGKVVLITEGEFKAVVVQHLIGEITLGLRGITEFNDTILKALIKANPKEVIVILDRDPKASAMMRTDGVSDSQRAAYGIAKQIQEAGIETRIGILPDAFQGAKVGMDDLVLAQGPEPLMAVIRSATSPQKYAENLGIDPYFHELTYRRQFLKRAVTDYKTAQSRLGSITQIPAFEQAQALVKQLDSTFQEYLNRVHNQSYSLNQATSNVSSLSRISQIPQSKFKHITSNSGAVIPFEFFTDEILLMDYAPKDYSSSSCKPAPCISFEYSQKEILEVLRTNDRSSALGKKLEKGLEMAQNSSFSPSEIQDYNTLILAGHLTETFPLEDYQYEFNVHMSSLTEPESHKKIPLVIRKAKSAKVVSISQLRVPDAPGSQSQFSDVIQFLR